MHACISTALGEWGAPVHTLSTTLPCVLSPTGKTRSFPRKGHYIITAAGVGSVTGLVQVEQGHNFFRVLGLCAGLQQQSAVMEGEADHLLHFADDLTVAVPGDTAAAAAAAAAANHDVSVCVVAPFCVARQSAS